MTKTTKFRKVASGGVDQGDQTLNRFGMLPVIQKSVGVSAVGSQRIAIFPDDGGEVLEIMALVSTEVGGSAASMTLDFGTSADTSAFGVVLVTGVGRYVLPVRNNTENALVVHGSGQAYTVTAGGTHLLVTVASASGGSATAPTFICYTTMLQTKEDVNI